MRVDTGPQSLAISAENSDTDHTAQAYSVGASTSRGYVMPQKDFRDRHVT